MNLLCHLGHFRYTSLLQYAQFLLIRRPHILIQWARRTRVQVELPFLQPRKHVLKKVQVFMTVGQEIFDMPKVHKRLLPHLRNFRVFFLGLAALGHLIT